MEQHKQKNYVKIMTDDSLDIVSQPCFPCPTPACVGSFPVQAYVTLLVDTLGELEGGFVFKSLQNRRGLFLLFPLIFPPSLRAI